MIPNCLTITEENEDELEQDEEIQLIQTNPRSNIILLDDDNDTILYENDQQIEEKTNLPLLNMNKREDSIERLSTIYESPSPQPDVDEDMEDENEKLIVYDIAKVIQFIPSFCSLDFLAFF